MTRPIDFNTAALDAAAVAHPRIAARRSVSEGTATGCLANWARGSDAIRARAWRDLVHVAGHRGAQKLVDAYLRERRALRGAW